MDTQAKRRADRLLIDKVRSEHRPGVEKDLFEGIRLFQQVRRLMIEGIRDDYPDADEAQIQRELDRRYRIAHVVENRPWTS